MVSGGQDWDPPSPGTVSWPLCYCYDGSMRLEAVNNIHYMRKIWLKVNWQFYYFISYLEDVLRLYIIDFNWTLITWEGPPTSELQPGEVAGRVEPNEHCLVELSGVWVLQIAATTPCLQGDYRVEDKNSRPREDIDFKFFLKTTLSLYYHPAAMVKVWGGLERFFIFWNRLI